MFALLLTIPAGCFDKEEAANKIIYGVIDGVEFKQYFSSKELKPPSLEWQFVDDIRDYYSVLLVRAINVEDLGDRDYLFNHVLRSINQNGYRSPVIIEFVEIRSKRIMVVDTRFIEKGRLVKKSEPTGQP